jgi:hypothetical protein
VSNVADRFKDKCFVCRFNHLTHYCSPSASLKVGAEDGGVEAIFRVVNDSDCLIFGVIRVHTQHGTKNLFLCNRHVVLHVHVRDIRTDRSAAISTSSRSNPGPARSRPGLSWLAASL